MSYKLKRLSNGLPLILAPIKGSKNITALLMVATGSKYENRDNNGISHFLEHMFFKGTEKRPNTFLISSELDKIGGEFNAFTGKEYTGYWVKTASNYIDTGLDVISDMLTNSKFDSEEIEREKGVIVEELNMYLDSPRDLSEDVFEECLYGDTPAGWSTIGTKKNILNFSRQDFLDYFYGHYNLNNSFLILAGDVSDKTESLAEKYFKKFPKGEALPKVKVEERQAEPNIKIHYKKTDQAHLFLGVRTAPYKSKEEFILKILAIVLGGTMSSRLFIELRERHGLAYYVRTANENYTDTGYLATRAGVPLDKIEKALKIILQEYKRISQELISASEMEKVKQFLESRISLQLETSDDVAEWYAKQAVLLSQQKKPLKFVKPEDFLKEIKNITVKDVKALAENIFQNQKLNLAIVGPYKDGDINNFKKILKM
jgi:predicted Zn-dependent peptidase